MLAGAVLCLQRCGGEACNPNLCGCVCLSLKLCSPTLLLRILLLPAEIEARLMVEAKPQYSATSNTRNDAVVICVHGFTGVPYEVAPTVKALTDLGIPAVAPLLPGHGYKDRDEQVQEFANITKAGGGFKVR